MLLIAGQHVGFRLQALFEALAVYGFGDLFVEFDLGGLFVCAVLVALVEIVRMEVVDGSVEGCVLADTNWLG